MQQPRPLHLWLAEIYSHLVHSAGMPCSQYNDSDCDQMDCTHIQDWILVALQVPINVYIQVDS